uniref:Uncharacterized protein n=1 Tax=viral metagenome TaxID=1070528 RepID=A0A2V0RI59_9ZZZZ
MAHLIQGAVNTVFRVPAALNNEVPYDWLMVAHGYAVNAVDFYQYDSAVRNGNSGQLPLRDAALRKLVSASDVDMTNACERFIGMLRRLLASANAPNNFSRRELDILNEIGRTVRRPTTRPLIIGAIDEFVQGNNRPAITHNHCQDHVTSIPGIQAGAHPMTYIQTRVPTTFFSTNCSFDNNDQSYSARTGRVNVSPIAAEANRIYYIHSTAMVDISSTVREALVSAGVRYCIANSVEPYNRAPLPLWLIVQQRLQAYWVAGPAATYTRLMTAIQFELDVLMAIGVMSLSRLC